MIKYPLTCIDNFFQNPTSIVNYANTLSYEADDEGRWPGYRSQPLHIIYPDFFSHICIKYLRAHHSEEDMKHLYYQANAHFQIVNTKYTEGWIHTDYPVNHTFIIYLSPLADLNSGTSFYEQKDGAKTIPNDYASAKKLYYKKIRDNVEITEKEKKFFNKVHKLNNSLFTETASFKNLFNRCIGFDGYLWHGAGKFDTNIDQDRLTLIVFFNEISTPTTGLQRSYSTPFTTGNKIY
tara:strand:+ start:1124 stop:1831 length:708 start_codon:yes stop_codon:yes gene_type:complete